MILLKVEEARRFYISVLMKMRSYINSWMLFYGEHKLSSESVAENDEVIQYLGGEAPSSISEIVKFGLFEEEGNFTYIVLKLQSDYNLAYNGMIFCYVCSVFS